MVHVPSAPARFRLQPNVHARADVRRLEWLGHVVGDPGRESRRSVLCLHLRGQEHHGHVAKVRIWLGAQDAAHLQPVAPGHVPVQQEKVRALGAGDLQRCVPVARRQQAVALWPECHGQKTQDVRVVVNEQDGR